MKDYSLFDIIGPIMIGPSSSHTAGAVKIGYMAKNIVGEDIKKVNFYLHGSFAKTYKGHGTDKALLAGVLGFLPDNERIKNVFDIAKNMDVLYTFEECDLGEVHPNSVKIIITTHLDEEWEIWGSSIGGGKSKIIKINEMEVEFDGEYTTLITKHLDYPGVVANITSVLSKQGVNIAFMKLFRESKASNALLIVEIDQLISDEVIQEISQKPNIMMIKVLKPI